MTTTNPNTTQCSALVKKRSGLTLREIIESQMDGEVALSEKVWLWKDFIGEEGGWTEEKENRDLL